MEACISDTDKVPLPSVSAAFQRDSAVQAESLALLDLGVLLALVSVVAAIESLALAGELVVVVVVVVCCWASALELASVGAGCACVDAAASRADEMNAAKVVLRMVKSLQWVRLRLDRAARRSRSRLSVIGDIRGQFSSCFQVALAARFAVVVIRRQRSRQTARK